MYVQYIQSLFQSWRGTMRVIRYQFITLSARTAQKTVFYHCYSDHAENTLPLLRTAAITWQRLLFTESLPSNGLSYSRLLRGVALHQVYMSHYDLENEKIQNSMTPS
jgi:hypothetical protein